MNVLLSPPARRSTGKNAENLKRPAEVTPVPSSTSVAKRSRHVTPKRIAKLESSQPGVKPQPNFFRAVYDMLEQSTAMNPKLIRWTEDGTAFSHDDKNIVKLSQWLTTFGTYGSIAPSIIIPAVLVAFPSRRIDSHIPLFSHQDYPSGIRFVADLIFMAGAEGASEFLRFVGSVGSIVKSSGYTLRKSSSSLFPRLLSLFKET
jgi:hypothetical protein